MFFINNPSLRKFETFMQEVPHFPPKGTKVDLDKLEDEILLFEVEKIIVGLKQHKGKDNYYLDLLNICYPTKRFCIFPLAPTLTMELSIIKYSSFL